MYVVLANHRKQEDALGGNRRRAAFNAALSVSSIVDLILPSVGQNS